MAGYDTLPDLVKIELSQSQEEGKDRESIAALRQEFEASGDDPQAQERILAALIALPVSADFPFDEPSELEDIRTRRPSSVRSGLLPYGDDVLGDRMYGAWLGRCAGCALGKPAEAYLYGHNGMNSRERLKRYLLAISPDEYPIKNYLPAHSPAEEETGKVWGGPSSREEIAFMESDDDLRYTVLGQMVLRDRGRDFTTWDIAHTWMNRLPYLWVCTAEMQAYRNLTHRYRFNIERSAQETIDWQWVATHQNPYREWIGAQIRADSWGYAAPGNPEKAAEYAWRDARLTHVKNGLYGEMLCAAMIAAAFVYDHPLPIVEAGLAEIPKTSRLAEDIRWVVALCASCHDDAAHYEPVFAAIYERLGHYSPVHTINNAALVVAALLLGGHDFEKIITLAVMGGWDTDCNGATAGSIAGAMLGAKALPARWITPLHDTLNSDLLGYHPIAISECARRSVEIAQAGEITRL